MFLTVNLKKIHITLVEALLFCLVTGIILMIIFSDNAAQSAFSEEVPKPLLIIDAGHGGADGGAVAPDGTQESLINLAVALKLEAMANVFGLETLMTRTSEELPYPESAATIAEKKLWDQRRRIELINSTENAVMISIHQNYYPDSRPSGAQVLYGRVNGSQELGELSHELLNSSLCPDNRRVAAPVSENIFLMKNAKCCAVLVECGFMSNPDELKKLLDETYQNKLAAVLLAAYFCHMSL